MMRCGTCQVDLSARDAGTEAKLPCPACGSMRRDFSVEVSDTVHTIDGGTLKQKRDGFKRFLTEISFGLRIGRDGRIVNRDALLDRKNHRFMERVETADGRVIVDKDEDLRDHHS